MSANARQVAGTHYASAYQHWDWCLEVLANRYLEGQITKYVSRARKKNGTQDYEKALHFLEKLIEAATPPSLSVKAMVHPFSRGAVLQRYADQLTDKFIQSNELYPDEASVILLIANWRAVSGLHSARTVLTHLIAAPLPG